MDPHQAVLIAQEARHGRPMPCMEGYGTRIQYSVFVCDLSDREMILMRGDVEALMKKSEDSVMVVDLGQAADYSRFLFLGHHEKLPSSTAVIV
jgi:CRISPR-associated protein Cas2